MVLRFELTFYSSSFFSNLLHLASLQSKNAIGEYHLTNLNEFCVAIFVFGLRKLVAVVWTVSDRKVHSSLLKFDISAQRYPEVFYSYLLRMFD